MQCNCETPAIIINKHLAYFVLSRIRTLQCDFIDLSSLFHQLSVKSHIHDHDHLVNCVNDFFYKQTYVIRHSTYKFDEKGNKIRLRSPFIDEIENGSSFTILDTSTGEREDIFQLCECGHCSLCCESKRSTWSIRCELECQSHPYLPYFITLTYNNEFLPRDGELSKTDLNNFVHRFRKNLLYKLGYDTPFRMLKCGEYGHLHGRPHYHLLIWFDKPILPFRKNLTQESHTILETFRLTELIETCWSIRGDFDKTTKTFHRKQIGFVKVEKCENDQAGKYLGKYLSKFNLDNNPYASNHLVKPFVIGTRKGGCIAKPFLLALRNQFLKIAPSQDLLYCDRHSEFSIPKVLPLNKWVFNVLCPTIARQIDKSLRDVYRQYQLTLHKLHLYAQSSHPELVDFLKDTHVFHIYGYDTCFALSQPSYLKSHELDILKDELLSQLFELSQADLKIEFINQITIQREKFLCYHLANYQPKPIMEKVESISRHLHLEKARHELINDLQ